MINQYERDREDECVCVCVCVCSGGPTKVINLYECTCPNDPYAPPSSCPAACPDVNRYQDMVPADQAPPSARMIYI